MNQHALIVRFAFLPAPYSHCQSFLKNRVDRMRIAIVGGNLTGLALAHFILDSNESVDVMVIEERAEIGFPCISPGIIRDGAFWLPILEKWGFSELTFIQMLGDGSVSLRRAWLEKSLSLSLVTRGASILLRTRVVKEDGNTLFLHGAGGSISWEGDHVVHVPEHEGGLQSWVGIVTSEETPTGWQRSDGSWESWQLTDSEEDTTSALEVIEIDISSFDAVTVDGALSRAEKLFSDLSSMVV